VTTSSDSSAGATARPKVSVAIITHNQAAFIGQAMESVLEQDLSEPIEIVIGDDSSSDGTRTIVEAFREQNPSVVRTILHPRNQGPRGFGGRENLRQVLRACRGEYVALLEGDDYWTGRNKLRVQAAFLDRHRSCSVVGHIVSIDYSGGRLQHWGDTYGGASNALSGFAELLAGEVTLPNSSLLFRRAFLPELPAWCTRVFNADDAIDAILATRGQIGFINTIMAVHRKHPTGVSHRLDDPLFAAEMRVKLLLVLSRRLHPAYREQLRERLLPEFVGLQNTVISAALRRDLRQTARGAVSFVRLCASDPGLLVRGTAFLASCCRPRRMRRLVAGSLPRGTARS
jgi:glycosyltransferase involved in cell wall biosynthesis